jgi:NitT/TauT family transport system substrate-binding protein
MGFYAGEGVEVELIDSSAPAAAAPALFDGSVDLTWGGPMRAMKARDTDPGSPLVCFCEVVARDPFFLVGRGGGAAFRFTDLPRLRCATVSEVPTPWLCLAHDLRERGIDPNGLNRLADRTMAGNLERLRSGALDVAQMFEPYASMALQAGLGDILYAASARGPTVYTTFLATRDGIERHRAALAAMLRAIARMQDWLAACATDELAEVVAPFYPDLARDILVRSLARYRDGGIWARTPEVSRQGFARLAASLHAGGFIARVPAYEDCVEQSLG